MKKVTFIFFFASALMFAQQPQSFGELTGVVTPGTQVETSITIVNQVRAGIIDTFDNQVDFDAAIAANCSDMTLTTEDFTGGPAAITTCGAAISSAGDDCFTAGDLEAGFAISAVGANTQLAVFIPNGAIGNSTELVGANSFGDYTVIALDPNVYAVSFDIWANSDPMNSVRVFGAGGLISDIAVTITAGTQGYFGVIADEPITSIEVEGANDSGELIGTLVYGAECMALSVNDNTLQSITFFPNPASNVVNVQTPAGVDIRAVAVYDVLGKKVANNIVNGQIDVSSLRSGVYMVSLDTTLGSITRKIVKK